jgi:psiF repeat
MKSFLVVIAITLLASNAAFAANPSCEAQAAEKKLAGAAKSSFIKKCDKDATEAATTACTTQATEKKLAGAAKSSFMKKCVKDATTAAK